MIVKMNGDHRSFKIPVGHLISYLEFSSILFPQQEAMVLEIHNLGLKHNQHLAEYVGALDGD